VLETEVPVLSIQPLVENAVKHGVACSEGDGFVRLSIRQSGDSVRISVSNSGAFGTPSAGKNGHGIGMSNVRRRLALYYGNSSDLEVYSADDVTTVCFLLPLPQGMAGGARSRPAEREPCTKN
jgi:two-component system LytT family sensor kinase